MGKKQRGINPSNPTRFQRTEEKGQETRRMKLKLVERVGILTAFKEKQDAEQRFIATQKALTQVMLDCGLDPNKSYTFTGDNEVVEQMAPVMLPATNSATESTPAEIS